ncbi:site-2 protease family protein [Paenibacillus hamazuiensis]|uniref:site-2 protease family protein n=1 Tax=Paenibacillus hamazuiensis TaxID=2936508 RepID=UPI00200C6042|nr:site-2 protease family protein [Paenibacillus hamazuiensis]
MIAALAYYFHTDTLLFRVIAFLIAATVHDAVHSAAALAVGDRTAREQGRLSLNPLAHIDALGLAMLLFGPYGWTKPLPVAAQRRRERLLVYAAGPAASLLLGMFFWWLYFSLPAVAGADMPNSAWIAALRGVLQYCIIVNLMYGVVHILPFYPLDGAGMLKTILPPAAQPFWQKYEKFGLIVTLILFISPVGQSLLERVYQYIAQWVMNIFAFPM